MSTDTEALKIKVKEKLIEYLNLLDKTPDDIADDEPLFGESLGLDSIDTLEMVVMMEREFGVHIADPKEGRKILIDVNHMVACIQERGKS